ncbi:hypothetical protein HDU76_011806, partial [Blyttiomyces sp. JEL0837]
GLATWHPLQCVGCATIVGEAYGTLKDADGLENQDFAAIKLFKHRVELEVGERSFKRSFLSFFVDELLDLVDAHASYKFAVFNRVSRKPEILIWLLVKGVLISGNLSKLDETRTAYPNLVDEQAAFQAVKLGYVFCDSKDETDIATVTEWNLDKQVERIDLDENLLDILRGVLLSSTFALPESDRRWDTFRLR